jgi:hypothetical protein
VKLTVTVTPGSKTADTSDNTVTHINGGSGNPNGYDVQNGVIVAIGSNVHVWLTPDSPDGAIKGDFVPTAASASQIHYYTSSGNANTDDSGKGHTDIFVVGAHTGGYYQQSDWPNTKYNFVSLKGITGNGGVTEGDVGKDYIFVQGNSADYTVTGVPHPQNHQNNDIDNLQITNKDGSHPYENANHIEGVVFGNGPSSTHGGSTDVSYKVTLNLDVNIESSDSNDHLNTVTFNGIPENATFTGNYVNVSYDAANKVYVMTFDSHTTHYSGQVSVDLPDGKSTLGDITLDVDTTASEHHDTHFDFDGEEGGQHVSDSHSHDASTADYHPDAVDESHTTDSHIAEDNPVDTDNEARTLSSNESESDKLTLASSAVEETSASETDHSVTTEAHSASLIDESSLMLSPQGADNALGSAETPTTTADNAVNPLSGDEHTDMASTEPATPTTESALSTSAGHDDTLNFSDIIHDEEHNDLSSLIQAGPQSEAAQGATEVEHVPAEGGSTAGAESYDAGHEAMVESLIAKPEEVS